MPISARLRAKFNRTVRFWPARRAEPGTLPAVTVAGVMVFAYVDKLGQLRVSIDLDTAHPALVERPAECGTVPLRVDVQGDTVYYEPSERAGACAWAVLGRYGSLELFADDWEGAERAARRRGRPLLRRHAGGRYWAVVADWGREASAAPVALSSGPPR